MARKGRKSREALCKPPPRGFYQVDWTLNELLRWDALSSAALRIHLTIRALSWDHGNCDPTDLALAHHASVDGEDAVRAARRELMARGLLVEYHEAGQGGVPGRRWLVPVPVLRGLEEKVPEAVVAEARVLEAALRAAIARAAAGEHSAFTSRGEDAKPIHLSSRPLKEEEIPTDCEEPAILLLTGHDDGEIGGAGERGGPLDEIDALAAFLEGYGMFPVIARRAARMLLERAEPDDARAWAFAVRDELQSASHTSGRPLTGEERVKIWVTRLRYGVRPRADRLEAARAHLAGDDAPAASVDEDLPEWFTRPPDDRGLAPLDCLIDGEMQPRPAREVWERALAQLRAQFTADVYAAWLQGSLAVGVEEGRLVVEVAREAAVVQLENRLRRRVADALRAAAGRAVEVVYRVGG